MERGLLWLPLLGAFIWLAWAGKNEYEKLETYRRWAEGFDRAKYDIYAVLGQKDRLLTWGRPTKKAIVDLQSFSLEQVQQINLLVDGKIVDLGKLPNKGKAIYLEFTLDNASTPNIVKVPFTEIPLASKWGEFLRSQLIK
jgi:hypothetical protein